MNGSIADIVIRFSSRASAFAARLDHVPFVQGWHRTAGAQRGAHYSLAVGTSYRVEPTQLTEGDNREGYVVLVVHQDCWQIVRGIVWDGTQVENALHR